MVNKYRIVTELSDSVYDELSQLAEIHDVELEQLVVGLLTQYAARQSDGFVSVSGNDDMEQGRSNLRHRVP